MSTGPISGPNNDNAPNALMRSAPCRRFGRHRSLPGPAPAATLCGTRLKPRVGSSDVPESRLIAWYGARGVKGTAPDCHVSAAAPDALRKAAKGSWSISTLRAHVSTSAYLHSLPARPKQTGVLRLSFPTRDSASPFSLSSLFLL